MPTIQIKVTPNAAKNELTGWKENLLQVRLKGVPEKGKVNDELICFLASTLKIAKSRIKLISGHTSRIKKVSIDGSIEILLP